MIVRRVKVKTRGLSRGDDREGGREGGRERTQSLIHLPSAVPSVVVTCISANVSTEKLPGLKNPILRTAKSSVPSVTVTFSMKNPTRPSVPEKNAYYIHSH